MKNSIIAILAIFIATINVYAQKKHSHEDKQQNEVVPVFDNTNPDVKTQIGNVLSAYYLMKDALVASDEATTKKEAKAFRKSLEMVDVTKMNSEEHAYFLPLQTKLDYHAEHIQGAPVIDHMREHFASFSEIMFAVAKAFKANNGTAMYFDYCPMQKASWISSEAAIKNPYYGKQMLTCGNIKETIK